MPFSEWMNKVEQILLDRVGLTSRDFDDYDYVAAYVGCESPDDAAINALCNAGYDSAIL